MGFWGKPKLNAMQLGFALGEGLDVWVSQTPAFGNFRELPANMSGVRSAQRLSLRGRPLPTLRQPALSFDVA